MAEETDSESDSKEEDIDENEESEGEDSEKKDTETEESDEEEEESAPIDYTTKLGIEEEVLWSCKACGHKITGSMEKENAPKSKVLPLNMGGVMIYTCPNCYTLQIPPE